MPDDLLTTTEPMPSREIAPMMGEGAQLMEVISRAARDPATDVDKLERLMSMYERITERRAKSDYMAALAEMQPELPVINERGRIEVRAKGASGQRDGEIQQSTTYATWEDINDAIRPLLFKHGFALSFRTGVADDGRIKVTGVLSHKGGHLEETTMLLPHDSTGSKNAVQAVGSSTSYGKRYTASALLNITTRGQDDDGQAAGHIGFITDEQCHQLSVFADEVGADKRKFCEFLGVDSFAVIPAPQFTRAKQALEAKRAARK